MCGLGAILYARPHGSAARRLDSMQRALAPRGPDGHGRYEDPHASLVHTRLALLDLRGGAQPMRDPTGRYALVFNGEIYNHRELRKELGAWPFRTDSDTETLLAMLVTHGARALGALAGMFAFVLWDSHARTAFAARDPLGVKPLVYSAEGSEVVLASTTAALLAQRERRPRVDVSAIAEHLLAPSLSGVVRSPFADVQHLGAGESLTIREHEIARTQWFRYEIAPSRPPDARLERDAAIELRSALATAVERAQRADVPVGAFLSGGVDSTALTALLGTHTPRPTAFTLRFDDHANAGFGAHSIVNSDDAPFVEDFAARTPMDLVNVHVSRASVREDLDAVARIDDRIPAWEQQLSQHRLALAASRTHKAVLVGDAADETHFGYFFLFDAPHRGPRALLDRFGVELRAKCLSPALREGAIARIDAQYRDESARDGYDFDHPTDAIRAMTAVVVRRWLGRLLHNGDVHTMAHGLEARVPFADPAVLAAASRVAPEWQWRDGVEKRVLREAARPWIPDAVYRRKKSALPREPRCAEVYQAIVREGLAQDPQWAREVLDVREVSTLAERRAPDESERMTLFNLAALLRWKAHHVG